MVTATLTKAFARCVMRGLAAGFHHQEVATIAAIVVVGRAKAHLPLKDPCALAKHHLEARPVQPRA